ncbi:MAG: hypothetical protein P4N60_07410 [Verrucomicrobiae bacterium]|nr:hypothetical protein [Verrucomicrobiae bacterium]
MIASILSSLADPASLWIWELVEATSIIIVGVGCWGEVWAEHHKFSDNPNDILPTSRLNKLWERRFWLMVVWGLGIELFAFCFTLLASNREIQSLTRDNLALQTKMASMNVTLIQLANQYDMSTNALAEAKARLESVKPLKSRLADWLNGCAPKILEELKSGQTHFILNNVPEYKFTQLDALLSEKGAKDFCSSVERGGNTVFEAGIGQVENLIIELKPALAQ